MPVPNTRSSRAVSSKNTAASKAEDYRWAKTQAVQKAKNEDIRTSATAKTIAQGKEEKRRTYDPLNAPAVPKGSVETFPSNNVEKARNEGIKAKGAQINTAGQNKACAGDSSEREVLEAEDDKSEKKKQPVGRQKGKSPRNNQAQNKQTRDIGKKLKLNKNQMRKLHDEITGQGYSYKEVLDIAKELFEK